VFDTWRQKRSEPPEQNLIPVMNLMMTLIPFLLLGASFFRLAVIPTSTSQLTAHDSDVPKTPTQVAVSLVIKPEGFDLTAASTSLEPDELALMATTLPKRGAAYDVTGLQKHLLGIKRAYPASTTILVFPDDSLGYQDLVDILDATREEVTPGEAGARIRKPLFPVTVFNRLVPPPPEEDVDGEGADGSSVDEGGAPEGDAPAEPPPGEEGAP